MRITAADLERWAEQKECEALLPELVRRLVNGSVSVLESVDFSSGTAVQRAGFDGSVVSRATHPFVPTGDSLWELSKEKSPGSKANEDYRKRTDNPQPGANLSASTYVQVTPRSWPAAQDWANKARAEGKWRDVRAYNSQLLAQWLERVPSAGAWLAEILGKPTAAMSLETVWREWSSQTVPPLSEEVIRARRDDTAELGLLRWLRGPCGALVVHAADAREVAGFLYAALGTFPLAEKLAQRDRAIVVDDDVTMRRVANEGCNLLIVATGTAIDAARAAAREGRHHILIATARPTLGEHIVLRELDRKALAVALENMGLDADTAQRSARESGGSLSAVRTRLGATLPEWDPDLAPLVLVGSWTESDLALVARIAGTQEEHLRSLARRWATSADAPLRDQDGVWSWVSRRAAWDALAPRLTSDDRDRFRVEAVESLSELSGAAHSPALVEGIVEGLAFVGTDERLERDASLVVSELFLRLNIVAGWASIDPYLPTLAEAAPDAFLHHVVGLLEESEELVREWLAKGSHRTSAAPAQGMVWALEALAWDPTYLPRAALALASLARLEKDRGIRERSLESLREIFLAWKPHTTAGATARRTVLQTILRDERDIGVALLVRLIPEIQESSSGTHTPRYRKWHTVSASPEQWDGARDIVDLFANEAEQRPVLWALALPKLRRGASELKKRVDSGLAGLETSNISGGDQVVLWTALRKSLHEHRLYPNAEWAFPDAELTVLAQAFDRLRPPDPVSQTEWLFDSHVERPAPRADSFDDELRIVDEERVHAVRELAQGGVEPVMRLVSAAESPELVGAAVARADPSLMLAGNVLSAIAGRPDALAERIREGIGRGAAAVDRHPSWIASAPVAASERAQIALGYPFAAETWDVVVGMGPECDGVYWKHANGHLKKPERDLGRALEKMLDAARAHDALHLAGRWATGKKKVALDAVLVERVMREAAEAPEAIRGDAMTDHYAGRLLGELRAAGIPRQQQLLLQHAWSSLLDDPRYRPEALFEELAADPVFFVHFVMIAHPPEDGSNAEPSPEESRRAQQTERVLRRMDRLPGAKHGDVDAAVLRTWIQRAREEGAHHKRRSSVDRYIGALLINSPVGADNIWPHESVRTVIEGLRQPADIEEAFARAVMNGRGVFSKAIGEGGRQEWSIAEHFENAAAALLSRWPTTAAALRRVADWYKDVARAMDREGVRERERFDWEVDTEARLKSYCDALQESGRHAFTLDSATKAPILRGVIGGRAELRRAGLRLANERRLVQPVDDFFAIVPPDYRAAGAPPWRWYIDDLMLFIGEPSYHVGLLSAAALHGAADQQPQALQVVVEYQRPPVVAGTGRIQFIVDSRAAHASVIPHRTETGTMRVASREWTMLELIDRPGDGGGFLNVVEVLKDLTDGIDAQALADSSHFFDLQSVQRAGWLLDRLGHSDLSGPLHSALLARGIALPETPLRPDYEDEPATVDAKWGIRVDTALDLEALAS